MSGPALTLSGTFSVSKRLGISMLFRGCIIDSLVVIFHTTVRTRILRQRVGKNMRVSDKIEMTGDNGSSTVPAKQK
jgi:hypothetical protein